MYDEERILELTIEITKEYARGGGDNPPATIRNVFDALHEVNSKTTKGDRPLVR